MSFSDEFVTRQYTCSICNKKHEINLRKNLYLDREDYPFSYTYLHGDLKNILTTLYIDKNMEIRGVDVQELTTGNIFSKEQVVTIVTELIGEIERLREENVELLNQINDLKK